MNRKLSADDSRSRRVRVVVGRAARCACGAVVGTVALVAYAQYQVNARVGQPVYGGGGSGGGAIRYGYVAPVAPASSNLLPSEARNAYYRSGAMPSEIRMNVHDKGPMAAGGYGAYIPDGSPVVIRSGVGPSGNAINTRVPTGGAGVSYGGNSSAVVGAASVRNGGFVSGAPINAAVTIGAPVALPTVSGATGYGTAGGATGAVVGTGAMPAPAAGPSDVGGGPGLAGGTSAAPGGPGGVDSLPSPPGLVAPSNAIPGVNASPLSFSCNPYGSIRQ